jgi:hypothetical protein
MIFVGRQVLFAIINGAKRTRDMSGNDLKVCHSIAKKIVELYLHDFLVL